MIRANQWLGPTIDDQSQSMIGAHHWWSEPINDWSSQSMNGAHHWWSEPNNYQSQSMIGAHNQWLGPTIDDQSQSMIRANQWLELTSLLCFNIKLDDIGLSSITFFYTTQWAIATLRSHIHIAIETSGLRFPQDEKLDSTSAPFCEKTAV